MATAPSPTVAFGCPRCGSKLFAPANSGTLEGPCPRCGEQIRASIPPGAILASETGTAAGNSHLADETRVDHLAQTGVPRSELNRVPEPASPSAQEQSQAEAQEMVAPAPVKVKPRPREIPGATSTQPPHELPRHLQGRYDAIVQKLAAYEAAGVPTGHPDRLHLVEELFRAASPEEPASFSPTDMRPRAQAQPQTQSRPQSGGSCRKVGSHLPPRRGNLPPRRRDPRCQPMGDRPLPSMSYREASLSDGHSGRGPGAVEAMAPPVIQSQLLTKRSREDRALRSSQKFTRLEKVGMGAIVLGVLIGAVLVFNYLKGAQLESDRAAASRGESVPVGMVEAGTVAAQPLSPLTRMEEAKIKEQVKAFHRAASSEAKIPFLIDGFRILDQLATYYETHPLEPKEVAIDSALTPVSFPQGTYYRGTGRYADGRSLEFYAARRGDEFLLDWPSLCGYSEIQWREFLQKKPEIPFEFRVIARQAPMGPGGALDPMRYMAVKVTDFESGDVQVAIADTKTPAGQRLKQVLAGAGLEPVRLRLKLAFDPSLAGTFKIVVDDFVSDRWIQPGTIGFG